LKRARAARLPLLLLAAFAWAGCASTVLVEGRYETACVSAGQCRPVFFGDACGGCACPNGAVNEQGKVRYDLDFAAIQCATTPDVACKCSLPLTACVDGRCVLQ